MNRRALIVVTPKSVKYENLPGAEADARNHTAFLKSAVGGAWEEHEIAVLRSPKKTDLDAALSQFRGIDYGFLAFSGHGYHVKGKWLDETRIIINDNEHLPVSEFTAGRDRELVIVDACRKVEWVELSEGVRKASLENALAPISDRIKSRKLFDDRLSSTERGRIEMYSCNLDESAGETPSGGKFTSALIGSANIWAASISWPTTNQILTTLEACKLANIKLPATQNPQYAAGRRLYHFPYGVKP